MTLNDDLSEYAAPLTDHFWGPIDESSCELSTDVQKQFHEKGYAVGSAKIGAEMLAKLLSDLDVLMQPGHPGDHLWHEYHTNESTNPDTILFHALGAWRIKRSFHDLLWHPAITVPAKQLLKSPVHFWHDQLFCKPAHHGGVVAWHQDYSYWTRTTPMQHLTCWIALEDASVDNGCLHYIPGSHKWELLPVTGLAGDMGSIKRVLNESQWETFQSPDPIELEAGQVVFHHPLTIHGSFENRTDRSRKAAVVNMIGDSVTSNTDEPLLEGIPVIPKGELLRNNFFPLLRP